MSRYFDDRAQFDKLTGLGDSLRRKLRMRRQQGGIATLYHVCSGVAVSCWRAIKLD